MTLSPRTVDRAFAEAWPAEEKEWVQGWLFRATSGVTRRGNSALALEGSDDLDDRLALVEGWYRERGLTPLAQIVSSSPPGMRAAMLDRGWVDGDGTCNVLSAPLGRIAGRGVDLRVTVDSDPGVDWVDVWWAVSSRGGEAERAVAAGVLERVPHPRAFALAHDGDGRPVASCLGVVARGLLVVESAATLPNARRRGACRALAFALARWAAEHGATDSVLSVEVGNEGGIAVWSRLGFRPHGGWRYLRAPADRLPSCR